MRTSLWPHPSFIIIFKSCVNTSCVLVFGKWRVKLPCVEEPIFELMGHHTEFTVHVKWFIIIILFNAITQTGLF